jgi:Holliday junction resolvase
MNTQKRNTQNVKNGKKFEKTIAEKLNVLGFFVREDGGLINGQCLDIFAARNNEFFIFECKHCDTERFDTRRITDNQKLTKLKMEKTGNKNLFFVYYNKQKDRITISNRIIENIDEAVDFSIFEEYIKKGMSIDDLFKN